MKTRKLFENLKLTNFETPEKNENMHIFENREQCLDTGTCFELPKHSLKFMNKNLKPNIFKTPEKNENMHISEICEQFLKWGTCFKLPEHFLKIVIFLKLINFETPKKMKTCTFLKIVNNF